MKQFSCLVDWKPKDAKSQVPIYERLNWKNTIIVWWNVPKNHSSYSFSRFPIEGDWSLNKETAEFMVKISLFHFWCGYPTHMIFQSCVHEYQIFNDNIFIEESRFESAGINLIISIWMNVIMICEWLIRVPSCVFDHEAIVIRFPCGYSEYFWSGSWMLEKYVLTCAIAWNCRSFTYVANDVTERQSQSMTRVYLENPAIYDIFMHEGFAIIVNPVILVYVGDDPVSLEDEREFFNLFSLAYVFCIDLDMKNSH